MKAKESERKTVAEIRHIFSLHMCFTLKSKTDEAHVYQNRTATERRGRKHLSAHIPVRSSCNIKELVKYKLTSLRHMLSVLSWAAINCTVC